MKKIGVFDSGLGGLSVAGLILKRFPQHQVLYFADNAHVPYGERPLEQIKEFGLAITEFLVEQGAQAVVMACNISSAVALANAREIYPDIPVVGMIGPGARAAVKKANGHPIGVLATTGTVKSGAYVRAIGELAAAISVYQQACPAFVPIVESGRIETEEAFSAVRECAEPLLHAGVSTVILGCTHYPFLKNAVAAAFGQGISLVDPAEETVQELHKLLGEPGVPTESLGVKPEHKFFVSGNEKNFVELGGQLLGRRIDSVERAIWGVDLGKVSV